MVELANLAGVFARHPTFKPSNMVAGFTADYVQDITEDGELILQSDTGRVDTVEAGHWLPIYKPSAIADLKSVAVLPLNGQLSSVSIRRGVRVPTYFCEQVFANSVLRWYKRVGNFVSPPGLIMIPSEHMIPQPKMTFQAVSVLPAIAFSAEGDAILWNLMAFEQGGDLFKDPEVTKLSKNEVETLQGVKDVLNRPENYFG